LSILYFDCFSGISGDMVIGALIHAGADSVLMEKELKKLNIQEEYELKWTNVIKNGISAVKFDVLLKDVHDHSHEHGHDHSHEHSHDHSHEHSHDHSHEHSHEHSHDHSHSHDHHGQRNYKQIVQMIESAGFTDSVRDMALRIFRKIGEAEGRIHGVPLEKVHFHEVGAVDSIIDIIGTAILIDQLGVTAVKSSPVPVGTGKIRIDHGIYPVPAPATLEILKGVPVSGGDVLGELATPTGAAIVSVLAEEFCSLPSMKVKSIGYGAGTKTFREHPNVLRVILGE
jgi:pyridinium-3,5-bisthiocarboxylic acid mononucleotide nickel chelatase